MGKDIAESPSNDVIKRLVSLSDTEIQEDGHSGDQLGADHTRSILAVAIIGLARLGASASPTRDPETAKDAPRPEKSSTAHASLDAPRKRAAAFAEDKAAPPGQHPGEPAKKKSKSPPQAASALAALKFPEALHGILSDPSNHDIISWLPHGRGFVIHDRDRLASQILSRHFEGAKYPSFMRRLRRWNFKRVMGAYYKADFLRDRPDLAREIMYQPKSQQTSQEPLDRQEEDGSDDAEENITQDEIIQADKLGAEVKAKLAAKICLEVSPRMTQQSSREITSEQVDKCRDEEKNAQVGVAHASRLLEAKDTAKITDNILNKLAAKNAQVKIKPEIVASSGVAARDDAATMEAIMESQRQNLTQQQHQPSKRPENHGHQGESLEGGPHENNMVHEQPRRQERPMQGSSNSKKICDAAIAKFHCETNIMPPHSSEGPNNDRRRCESFESRYQGLSPNSEERHLSHYRRNMISPTNSEKQPGVHNVERALSTMSRPMFPTVSPPSNLDDHLNFIRGNAITDRTNYQRHGMNEIMPSGDMFSYAAGSAPPRLLKEHPCGNRGSFPPNQETIAKILGNKTHKEIMTMAARELKARSAAFGGVRAVRSNWYHQQLSHPQQQRQHMPPQARYLPFQQGLLPQSRHLFTRAPWGEMSRHHHQTLSPPPYQQQQQGPLHSRESHFACHPPLPPKTKDLLMHAPPPQARSSSQQLQAPFPAPCAAMLRELEEKVKNEMAVAEALSAAADQAKAEADIAAHQAAMMADMWRRH